MKILVNIVAEGLKGRLPRNADRIVLELARAVWTTSYRCCYYPCVHLNRDIQSGRLPDFKKKLVCTIYFDEMENCVLYTVIDGCIRGESRTVVVEALQRPSTIFSVSETSNYFDSLTMLRLIEM